MYLSIYSAEFRQDDIDVARKGVLPVPQVAKDSGLSIKYVHTIPHRLRPKVNRQNCPRSTEEIAEDVAGLWSCRFLLAYP